MNIDDDGDPDAAVAIFGPAASPWLTAAKAIQTGDDIPSPVLSQIKPDIDRQFQAGKISLLQFSWNNQNVNAIGQLLAAGANPQAPGPLGQENEDLIYQILSCQTQPLALDALNVLLSHGVKADSKDSSDQIPILQYAVDSRNLVLAERLLAAGADPWAVSGGTLAPYSTVRNAADNVNLPYLNYLAQIGAFDGRSVDQVRPIIKSLARIEQTGDEGSKAIQATVRLIMKHSHYPPDASTRYILGTP